MKRRIIFGLTSLFFGATVGRANSATEAVESSAHRIFDKIERQWAMALVKADKAMLDRLEAPDYTVVLANGAVLTKAQSDGELLKGNQHFDALEISAVVARRSGNLAVVTGRAQSRESYMGQDNSGWYEFIDVFERREGQWMAVRAQLTRVAPPF
jgi:Domain of unknown function (DUF4440)